jgi:hypothetical protein
VKKRCLLGEKTVAQPVYIPKLCSLFYFYKTKTDTMTPQSLTPDGGNNNKITWGDAVRWTKNFRDNFGNGAATIRGYSISAEAIRALLSQNGNNLYGLKMYFGYDEEKNFRLIIVGTHENGNDYNVPHGPQEPTIVTEEEPLLGDTRPCPIYCGTSNVLNGGE